MFTNLNERFSFQCPTVKNNGNFFFKNELSKKSGLFVTW